MHPLLDCWSAQEVRILSHDYLKNRIRQKTDPSLLRETLLREGHAGTPVWKELTDRLEKLCELFEDAHQGYSPAQLVDRLPAFRTMDMNRKAEMRRNIHIQFQIEFGAAGHTRVVKAKLQRFRESIEIFLHSSEEVAAEVHHALDSTTAELLCELNKLPKGVWLWLE